MKRAQAIIVAAAMTGLLALGMVAVGAGALANKNVVPTLSRSSAAGVQVSQTTAPASAEQMQALVAQYQARLAQDEQQLQQANTQIQQLQNVLVQLQQRGVISIGADGTISLGRGRESRFLGGNGD